MKGFVLFLSVVLLLGWATDANAQRRTRSGSRATTTAPAPPPPSPEARRAELEAELMQQRGWCGFTTSLIRQELEELHPWEVVLVPPDASAPPTALPSERRTSARPSSARARGNR